MTITGFIEARAAEREALANKCAVDPVGAMEAHFEGEALHEEQDWALYPERRTEYSRGQADALHWAATRTREQIKPLTLHDPARALREVAAVRAIVKSESSPYVAGHVPASVTLRQLAAIDAGHPDYDPSWAPVQVSA